MAPGTIGIAGFGAAGRDRAPLDAAADRAAEHLAMRRALTLAERSPVRGPNPRVGCVLLGADGTVLAEGWHRGAGTPHAEADALQQLAAAGRSAAGATAVVTLEPCAHQGRTPPCADALIAAGVRRVVIGTDDPHRVAAGGAAKLRAAGIEVVTGTLEAESTALNRRWLHAVRLGRPHVTWKFAATLDGRSAAVDGTSRWITGPEARADVHRRRAEMDAIVVGTGTVLADDPALTVRLPGADGATSAVGADGTAEPPVAEDLAAAGQPLRVVIGRRGVPAGARVLDAAAPTLHLPTRDLALVLRALHEREVRSVWLEGGPTLAAAFWRAGLVDEVLCYVAPALLGAGPAAVADLGIGTMTDIARLDLQEVHRLGQDVLLRAVPRPPSVPAEPPTDTTAPPPAAPIAHPVHLSTEET